MDTLVYLMLCGFNVVTKQIDLPVAFNQLNNYTHGL